METFNTRSLLRQLLLSFMLVMLSVTVNAAEVVDINRADAATMIANWKGIGEVKAKAIVAYRKKNGPFGSISDLANVTGIGEKLIKNNKKLMSVSGGAAKTTAKAKTTKSTKKTTTKSTKKSTDSTKKKPTKKKTDKKKPLKKKTTETKTSS